MDAVSPTLMAGPQAQEPIAVAVAHFKAGRLAEADRLCRQILREQPRQAEALHLLGRITCQVGKPGMGAALIGKAIAIDPNVASYHVSLGQAAMARGNHEEAAASFSRAIALDGRTAKAHACLSAALKELGRVGEALASAERAVALDPHHAGAHHSLAGALIAQGRQEEAIASLRRALALKPQDADIHSNLLFLLHYLPTGDRETLWAEAKAWGERHAQPLARAILPHRNAPDPDRRLRIGYVSGDLRRHPVGYFLAAVLAAHDKRCVEVFCYATLPATDDLTERLRAAADHWHSLVGVSEEAAADMLRGHGIDILVDLSGHTAGNALLLFARKPAPVQATWIGYFDTTGVSAIDYLIADRVVCPEGDDRYFVERVMRLPDGYLCYTPQDSPAVAPPPSLGRGYPTFGCFNNIAKITPEVVALWGEILRRLPAARLCLKTSDLGDASVRDRYTRLFAGQGVAADRLTLLGKSPPAEYLAAYGEVDVALDPFPYTGGTITADALWMGVPVVTLRGERFAGRMASSYLTAVGLEELIAESPRAYVEQAVALAGDGGRLATLRAGLRQRMAQSPLCDGPRFTRGLEAAYRQMWRTWCAGEAGGGGERLIATAGTAAGG